MISIDQVLLLEEKVESAVKKIEQLNAENAALRSKCVELSNALNAKSEQFSSFQNDQTKIEEGILKALSRLNAVENVVLSAASAAQSSSNQSIQQNQPVQQEVQSPVSEPLVIPAQSAPQNSLPENEIIEETVSPENASEPQIAQEIEIPVEPQFQSQPVSEPQNANPAGTVEPSDSLAPNIDFEFGESDVSEQSASNPASESGAAAVQGSAQPEEPKSQPLFDIF